MCSLFCLFTVSVLAADDEYTELVSVSGADKLENSLDEDTLKIVRDFNISIDNSRSILDLNGYDLIKRLVKSSLGNKNSIIGCWATFLAAAAIYAVVSQVIPSDTRDRSDIFGIVASSVCIATVMIPMKNIIIDTASAISSCSVFMLSFIPVYAGVTVSSGMSASGTAYSTLMFAVTQVFENIADNIVIPVSGMLTVTAIGAPFSLVCERISVLLKKISIAVMTLGMTVFVFVLGLQTSIASATDNLGIKTAKTAVGTFVPIVGPSLSETLSVLVGSVKLLRSTVGAYAVICLAVIAVPITVRLLLWRMSLSAFSTVMELVGAKIPSKLLEHIAGAVTVMICIMLCSSVALLISVALTLAVGG